MTDDSIYRQQDGYTYIRVEPTEIGREMENLKLIIQLARGKIDEIRRTLEQLPEDSMEYEDRMDEVNDLEIWECAVRHDADGVVLALTEFLIGTESHIEVSAAMRLPTPILQSSPPHHACEQHAASRIAVGWSSRATAPVARAQSAAWT